MTEKYQIHVVNLLEKIDQTLHLCFTHSKETKR